MNNIYDSSKAKVYREYEGTLDLHWETGYEGSFFAHLYVDKFDYKNPSYNKNDINSGPEFYRSYEGMVSLDFKDEIEIMDSPDFPEFNGLKFLIGNRDMGSKDKFQLGRCYPINVDKNFDLKKWKKMFSTGQTKAKARKLIKKVCVYGGTFDPFHNGHLEIVKNLTHSFDEVLVLVNNNWTKNYSPLFSLDERINSVKSIEDGFLKVKVLDWAKTEDTSSTYNTAVKIKELYGITPHVVIGSDNLHQIEKWKNSEKLLSEFPFVIANRKGFEIDKDLVKKLNISYFPISGISEVSSTQIKQSHSDDLIPNSVKKLLDLTKLK